MAYTREFEIYDVTDNDKAQAIKAMSSLFNNIAEMLNSDNVRDYIDNSQMDLSRMLNPI